jgi:thiol-disulfide isomerase/thioredoxin
MVSTMTDATETSAIQYPCAHCGRTNRILRERLLDDPTCGACKLKIFPPSPVTATDGNWAQQVDACPIPVLVDLWAPWCVPCRTVAQPRAELGRAFRLLESLSPKRRAAFVLVGIEGLSPRDGALLLKQIRFGNWCRPVGASTLACSTRIGRVARKRGSIA